MVCLLTGKQFWPHAGQVTRVFFVVELQQAQDMVAPFF